MNTSQVLREMVRYFEDDTRRINHTFKVYGFAGTIAAGERIGENTEQIILLAAVLHDIGIKEAERKYNSSAGHYQESEGPPIAAEIMKNCGVTAEISDRVCYLVGHHHSYNRIDGIDFQILVEADLLVNSYEDEMKQDVVESVGEKVFRTETGKSLLKSMYLD